MSSEEEEGASDNPTFLLDCMGLMSAEIRRHTLVGT